MSNYPTSIDGASTLYNPADAFSSAPLKTTLTSSLSPSATSCAVASTTGFSSTWGIISIDDEIIIYESKDGTDFFSLHRGAFGSSAGSHSSGANVQALMVSGYITALQSAVVAIETVIGTSGSYNFGSVKSVGLSMPGIFSVSGSPVTGIGTISVSLATQTANKVFAGPTTGSPAAPTFRSIVAADLGTGTADSTTYLRGDLTWATPSAGSGTVTSVALSMPSQFGVSGSPITSSGTLAVSWNNQNANTFLSGPSTGSPAAPTFRAITTTDLGTGTANSTTYLRGDLTWATPPGSGGTVTSVGISMPSQFGVTGSPVTTSGTLTITWNNQTANYVLAGPTSGGSAAPTFRAIVAADLGTGTADSTKFLRGDLTWQTFTTGTVTSVALSMPAIFSVSGSPITGSGTLTVTLVNQNANLVFSGPSSGSAAAPTFRSLVTADIPTTLAGTTFTGVIHGVGEEHGPYQTSGYSFENLVKSSEEFDNARWSYNTPNITFTANNTVGPDGNSTADKLTATSSSPIMSQLVGGLTAGTTMTAYIWLKTASGSVTTHLEIIDAGFSNIQGSSAITITPTWTRFKVTGAVASGQTQIQFVLRSYGGDTWTTGDIYAWGACLQTGNDPQKAYVRTWETQIGSVSAGSALGSTIITTKDTSEIPLQIYGPNSPLSTRLLLQVNSGGELLIAGGSGNGYMLSAVSGSANPSGWAGNIRVKDTSGSTIGYILLYTSI